MMFFQLKGKGFTDNTEKYGILSLVLYYAQFAPQYDRWVDATALLNKFDTGNTYSMWSLFVFTLINRSIPLLNEGDLKPFAFCMILSIGGGMAFNFYIAWHVPCARLTTLVFNGVESFKMVLWIVIWLSHFHVAIIAWILLLLVPVQKLHGIVRNLFEKYFDPSEARRIPIDVELMAERLGLLIVLAIGEVMMTTVKAAMPEMVPGTEITLPPEFTSWRPLFSTLLAIGLAGHTKLAYFDTYGCPGEEESGVEKHAFKMSINSSFYYIRFHMIAVMSIVLSAGMMEIGDEEYEKGEVVLSFNTRVISGLAFAGINASFGILREQHKYEQCLLDNELVSRRVRLYVLVVVCLTQVLSAVLVPFSDPLLLQFMGQALFAANIFFEECCRNRWLKDPLKGAPKPHAIFTDHHNQEGVCSTSAGGLTHITTYHNNEKPSLSAPLSSSSSSQRGATERDALLGGL